MASRYSGVQRVLAKLEASINSGNYYEAHQMYRTIYFRYLRQKKHSELLELLYRGSMLLLQHEQHASGADLGILFINVLTRGTERTQSFFEKITSLFSLMSPISPEREVFVQSALKWSIIGTDYKTGHPDLHQMIAQVFWREKNYIMARQHFIHSRDGSGCAAMLVELHEQRGYMNEIDLFITQAVLQYLCLHNKATAQEAFNSYTSRHPKINNSGPPYLLPLLNFLFFLLKTIDSGKLAVFTVLCEQYQIALNRDPCYRQYLDKIGQLFFNIPPPRPHNQGLFGSILQSFINGLEDDDSDDEQRNAASTSHAAQELD
ncbi:hypothetical protein DMN91_009509 [Ooceraea biroi]|uniref:Golgi to ER traffic protein 4-like protein n=1 Tax=Ooceraea biroi TaxID=2015173 RepID=A0A026WGF1_OOCBI|nr:Golgi to ER traffic protein 4 homolog [Ooceraea biroi]XP_011337660.1 Golgi to ER traffic protein 4 homolog [Ooceraea biroi]EZA55053.1 Golgi to ER traffic protein 4-like protein [Ooceraea biroi]RLU19151.1 hypothetical protein DMN91_009509 [Ooceraea biroi]